MAEIARGLVYWNIDFVFNIVIIIIFIIIIFYTLGSIDHKG